MPAGHGYQTFDDLTFAERTFADFWGRTFGALTNGDQSNDIWWSRHLLRIWTSDIWWSWYFLKIVTKAKKGHCLRQTFGDQTFSDPDICQCFCFQTYAEIFETFGDLDFTWYYLCLKMVISFLKFDIFWESLFTFLWQKLHFDTS